MSLILLTIVFLSVYSVIFGFDPSSHAQAKAVMRSDIDALFGSGNWFCFPDRPDSVGVKKLPEQFIVKYPLISVDISGYTFTVGQTAGGVAGGTAYLQTVIPHNQCPYNQQAALAEWGQLMQKPLTRELIDSMLGPGNWYCLDQTNALRINDVKPQQIVQYPLIAIDKDNVKYPVGELVPAGGKATAWIQMVLPTSECAQ